MSAPAPTRVSKRHRGEAPDDASSAASSPALAPASVPTSKKSKASKKKATDSIPEEEVGDNSAVDVEMQTEGSPLPTSISLIPSPSMDPVGVASELRSIQQVLVKASSEDLLKPQLWRAFINRLTQIQPNTVRIDLHVLTSVGKCVSGILDNAQATSSFALLPSLEQILLLLLPSSSTPITQSWATTFRPNYDFCVAFLSTLVRHTVHSAASHSLPASMWQLLAVLFDSMQLVNRQQTSQRKVYDHALQERCLPMWAELHQVIQMQLKQESDATSPLAVALSECAKQIEKLIESVFFHSEHLNLYADALGNIADEDAEPAEDNAEESPATEAAESKDSEESEQQAAKKAKVEANGRPKKQQKSVAHKPHPMNYSKKLFDVLQSWLSKDDSASGEKKSETNPKKRKADAEGDAAAAPAPASYSSRSIRSVLPLLFGGYISASTREFEISYPSAITNAAGQIEREVVLTGLELRKKQAKERLKTQRELQFLQKMWSLNEQTRGQQVELSSDALPAIFTAALDAKSMPLLHDIFSTNAKLFQLIDEYDIYKINQDANVSATSSAGIAFTGFKRVLADQMDKVMAVARSIISAQQSQTKEADKKKKVSKAASVDSASSPLASLLSLSAPLLSNILYLLQLNPEFLLKYLHVKQHADMDISVWHVLWKVIQLHETSAHLSAAAVADALMRVLSPPSSALSSLRSLSQQIVRSFFKLRQFDVIFNSYVAAARTVAKLDASLHIVPLSTINGPQFDLSAQMRLIPPLKVPNLWDWFLTQCQTQFTADAKYSTASSQSLVHFFVYFLDSMLVREEIAVQLQTLYTKSIQQVVTKPFHAIYEQSAQKKQAKSQSSLDSASLFLLLHSLNDVKIQCDQHTTKTYETMLQPLPPYFQAFQSSESTSSSIRLTTLIQHLSAFAASDALLAHSLRLLSLQRLRQLARYQSRNILSNTNEADEAALKSDTDDDEDEKAVKRKKRAALTGKETVSSEAEYLTGFLLGSAAECNCSTSSSVADHSHYEWGGAAASLASSTATASTSAVALWQLITSHLDVIAQFASAEQKKQLISQLFTISACRFCLTHQLQSAANTSSSSSLHTLSSLTRSLLIQPWFFEVASLRQLVMEYSITQLLDLSTQLLRATDNAVLKEAEDITIASTPSMFSLSATYNKELTQVRQIAGLISAATKPRLTAAPDIPTSTVWQCIWLLQLLHSFPQQYLLSQASFHHSLLYVLWGMECVSSQFKFKEDSKSSTLLHLTEIATVDVTSAATPSLFSHLFLACRRMSLYSLSSLASSSPSLIPVVFSSSYLNWFCWTSFQTSLPRAQHVALSQEATARAVKLSVPAILAKQAAQKQKAEEEQKSKKTANTSTASILSPLVERLSNLLSASATSSDSIWAVQLSSALVDSFVPACANQLQSGMSMSLSDLSKSFKVIHRDSAVVQQTIDALAKVVNGKLIKKLEKSGKEDDQHLLQGAILDLYARLLVVFAVERTAELSDVKQLEQQLLSQLPAVLSVATQLLTSTEGAPSTLEGSLTLVQALALSLPTLTASNISESVTFSSLLSICFQTLSAHVSSRAETSTVHSAITAAVLSLMSQANEEQCVQLVELCLNHLNPASVGETSQASVSSSLAILYAFITHTYASAQRRAISHPRLSLLFYRLAVLSSGWSVEDSSISTSASSSLSLASSALQLLTQILNRHQLFSLDDAALSLIALTLTHCASLLKESPTAPPKALYHPLYLALYALVKHHSTSLVKILPVYLSLLRQVMSCQWRSIQRSTARAPLALIHSENLSRLLEELSRSSNAKMVNKYVVGLLLDWIHISKHKGAQWGKGAQDEHVKAINKGLFAVLNICEEHDLSYLNNLLDASGRASFRTLHAAFKKTRFTGLV